MSSDPFDSAMAAAERANIVYGHLNVASSFVVLIKGQGKVPYVEGTNLPEDRRTEVRMSLNPLDESGLTKLIERSVIAESREWSAINWGSAKALGVAHPRDLQGQWTKAEMVKSGRTFTAKDGETVEPTTFKFLAFYESREACLAAFQVDGATAPADAAETDSQPSAADGMEYETAKSFLPALIAQAAGDKTKLAETLASIPMVAKHFSIDSPEVQALLGGQP